MQYNTKNGLLIGSYYGYTEIVKVMLNMLEIDLKTTNNENKNATDVCCIWAAPNDKANAPKIIQLIREEGENANC